MGECINLHVFQLFAKTARHGYRATSWDVA